MELQILIDASNGASDYGNKFGEPLIQVLFQASEHCVEVVYTGMHVSVLLLISCSFC